MHDVPLVVFKPVVQAEIANRRLHWPVRFRPFLETYEQPVRRDAQAADNLKCLSCTLMAIAERFCPACRIESQIEASVLRDVPPAADVDAGLIVR
jgi:hypothetical protein